MAPIVVMTGGGIKGAVAAARSAADNELLLVHVDYGQPSAAAELNAARALAKTFPCLQVMPLALPHVAQLQRGPAAPGESSPPDGRTEAGQPRAVSAASLRGLMPVLMSLGVQCALRVGALKVVTGVTRVCDATHLGLPPATPSATDAGGWREFVHSLNIMIVSLSPQWSRLKVEAPLMDVTYSQVIKLARHFGVPLEMTWTCECRGPEACGGCEPCKARTRAFVEAAMVDPLTRTAAGPGTCSALKVAAPSVDTDNSTPVRLAP